MYKDPYIHSEIVFAYDKPLERNPLIFEGVLKVHYKTKNTQQFTDIQQQRQQASTQT